MCARCRRRARERDDEDSTTRTRRREREEEEEGRKSDPSRVSPCIVSIGLRATRTRHTSIHPSSDPRERVDWKSVDEEKETADDRTTDRTEPRGEERNHDVETTGPRGDDGHERDDAHDVRDVRDDDGGGRMVDAARGAMRRRRQRGRVPMEEIRSKKYQRVETPEVVL